MLSILFFACTFSHNLMRTILSPTTYDPRDKISFFYCENARYCKVAWDNIHHHRCFATTNSVWIRQHWERRLKAQFISYPSCQNWYICIPNLFTAKLTAPVAASLPPNYWCSYGCVTLDFCPHSSLFLAVPQVGIVSEVICDLGLTPFPSPL